ncbi:MAG: CvpA family protein [Christensenellaceae bacterium]|jgi:uncharacterized membrane protein required for colicin V production|nr:CvpA family protein [Christensenellaceae bacterium]
MYLDIGISIFLLICLGYGWFKGFMNGVIGFVSGALSLAIAIPSAKGVSKIINKWFGLGKTLDGIIKGAGNWLSILICGIGIYLLCRFFFWGVSRAIKKFKEQYQLVDKVDRIAGLFLGLAKCALGISILFIVVYLLTSIPLMNNSMNWLLKGSKVGSYLYHLVVKFIIPLLRNAKAAILG